DFVIATEDFVATGADKTITATEGFLASRADMITVPTKGFPSPLGRI
ncbi:hypothetical protein A2U01_0067090, partial [Trifolium medium]|nr:hypothetical protein [Trifolium medium]